MKNMLAGHWNLCFYQNKKQKTTKKKKLLCSGEAVFIKGLQYSLYLYQNIPENPC